MTTVSPDDGIKPTDAPAPFNRDDADVVLLSSDNMAFRCHKIILSIASPTTFTDMFVVCTPTQVVTDDIPVIALTEHSRTLHILLRMIYPPLAPPTLDNLPMEEVANLLVACDKYDLPADIVTRIQKPLEAYFTSKPLQVYALACRFNMEELAAKAAQKTKAMEQLYQKKASGVYIPEMDHVSAGAYFRLQVFFSKNGSVSPSFQFVQRHSGDGMTSSALPFSAVPDQNGRAHWANDASRTPETFCAHIPPDLHVTSARDKTVDILAHKSILALVSPKLAKDIANSTVAHSDGRAILELPEDGRTVRNLVSICYGSLASTSVVDPVTQNVDTDALVEVARAARAYSMQTCLHLLKLLIQPFLSTDPFQAYFVAVACEWEWEAREAARFCLYVDNIEGMYVAQMENVGAKTYYNLLKYHAECKAVIKSVKESSSPTRRRGFTGGPNTRFEATAATLLRYSPLSAPDMHPDRSLVGDTKVSLGLLQRKPGGLIAESAESLVEGTRHLDELLWKELPKVRCLCCGICIQRC